jgi:hypothetical protein
VHAPFPAVEVKINLVFTTPIFSPSHPHDDTTSEENEAE